MNNTSMAFMFTFLAGLSTLIGMIPIFIKFKNEDKLLAISLAFAAGVMLCVSITDLIPESLNLISRFSHNFISIILSFIFIVFGIIISFFIESIFPKCEYNTYDSNLYKVGVISMLAIALHNLPEGVITYISTTKSTTLGLSLAFAIALHNVPEGISISIPIYYSTRSVFKAFYYTLISALSEPLGALLTYLFLSKFITNTVLGFLFSLIAGIMMEISLIHLLPTSLSYKYSKLTIIFFILGVFFMCLKFLF